MITLPSIDDEQRFRSLETFLELINATYSYDAIEHRIYIYIVRCRISAIKRLSILLNRIGFYDPELYYDITRASIVLTASEIKVHGRDKEKERKKREKKIVGRKYITLGNKD
ncbi:MAG: hypothetical protein QXQ68_07410 [Candidatus Nitrosocaldaceae archaeon]